MVRFRHFAAKKGLLSAGAVFLLASAALWSASRTSPQLPRDFEDCMQQVSAKQLPANERGAATTACNASFAGRRKAGGGYTYYDFMQNRSFDIAGPNPTLEEAKRIDLEYVAFLQAQRGAALLLETLETAPAQIEAEPERAREPVGPPVVLTPRIPSLVAARRPAERAKASRSDEGSSCIWERLAANVRAAVAPSKVGP